MELKGFFETYNEWKVFYEDYVKQEKKRKLELDDYVYALIDIINNRFETQAERDLHIMWFKLTDYKFAMWTQICKNLKKFAKLNKIAQHVYGIKKDDMYAMKETAKAVPIKKVFEYLGITVNRNWKACCPFHNEKHPSLKLYPYTNTWHCFGCTESGDGISLVMKKLNIDFKAALGVINGI